MASPTKFVNYLRLLTDKRTPVCKINTRITYTSAPNSTNLDGDMSYELRVSIAAIIYLNNNFCVMC